MAEAAGALAVRIGADVSDLVAGFNKAEKETEAFGKAITRVGAVVAVAATALAAIVKTSADTADELGKLSQKTGVSVEALSELKYAGQLADVSLEQLGTGLKKLAKNMVDASDGTGEAAQAFGLLGISVKDSSGNLRASEEVFKDVADKFADMKDGAGKTTLAMQIFGKAGADLIPMLNQGRAGLKEAADEAARFGVVVSTQAAKQAEEFNDNLTRLKVAAEGWKNSIGNALIPSLIELQNEMLKGMQIAGGFWESIRLFGTINPFRSLGGNIKELTADLEALEKGLEKRKARGWNTEGFEKDIADKKKQIEYLKYMQQQDALKLGGAGSQDARDRMAAAAKPAEEKKDAPRAAFTVAEAAQREKDVQEAIQKAAKDGAARYNEIQYGLVAEEEKRREQQLQRDRDVEEIARRVRADNDARELEQIAKHNEALLSLRYEMDPVQAEMDAHAAKMARLAQFSEEELAALGGKQAVIEKMEGDHIARVAQIKGSGDQRIFKMVNAMREGDIKNSAGYLAELTSGLAQHSRKMFELNKAAGIANAIIAAYEGISMSLKAYPMPWAAVAAAAHAAIAFAQVQAIRSQTFSGGGAGAAPSIAGSTAAPAVSPVSGGGGDGGASRQTTVVNLHGETFGREQVRGLMERINEEGRDGGRIVIIDRP